MVKVLESGGNEGISSMIMGESIQLQIQDV